MPLVPEEPEAPATPAQRVTRAIVAPVRSNGPVVVLALAAGIASYAPDPLGAFAAALLVVAASDASRRR